MPWSIQWFCKALPGVPASYITSCGCSPPVQAGSVTVLQSPLVAYQHPTGKPFILSRETEEEKLSSLKQVTDACKMQSEKQKMVFHSFLVTRK